MCRAAPGAGALRAAKSNTHTWATSDSQIHGALSREWDPRSWGQEVTAVET